MPTQKPIFYDPTGRRKKASAFGVVSLIIAAVILFVGLVASILMVPVPERLDLHMEYPKPSASKMLLNHASPRHRPLSVRGGVAKVQQTLAGFYVTGDDASLVSLQKHVNTLDMVIPGLAYIGGADNRFVYLADDQFTYTLQNAQHRPSVLIMVQNITGGQWQGANTAHLLASPAARLKLIGQMLDMVQREKAQGVVLDFETLPDPALRNYLTFVREAHAAFATKGYLLTLTAPVDNPAWNLKSFGASADKLFLMIYDQHSMVDPAGAIAAQGWFNDRLNMALKSVPPDKAIVCIGNYGYDWYKQPNGQLKADPTTVAEAWRIARESDAPIQFDPASGNAYFFYDEEGLHHEVWLLDGVSAWNQLLTIADSNVSGVGLWRLGSEGPGHLAGLQHLPDQCPA